MNGVVQQTGSPSRLNRRAFGIGCLLLGMPRASALAGQAPLLRLADARRFLRTFRDHGGRPTADQLEAGYLRHGSPALQAFDHAAIGGAEAMASAILATPTAYARAAGLLISEIARLEMTSRRLIEAYERLSPSFVAPEIHLLFGSGTSSGQKLTGRRIALAPERFLASANWAAPFEELLAHELGHASHPDLAEDSPERRDILMWAMREGAANVLAALALGREPWGVSNAWAMEREADLLAAFSRDRETVRVHWTAAEPDTVAVEAGQRWLWNEGTPGRPADLGYWVGQRLWFRRWTEVDNPAAVISEMVELKSLSKLAD